MTVRELRHLLFNVENQDATVVVVGPNDIEQGHVKRTHEVRARRNVTGDLAVGHEEDPQNFVSILTN